MVTLFLIGSAIPGNFGFLIFQMNLASLWIAVTIRAVALLALLSPIFLGMSAAMHSMHIRKSPLSVAQVRKVLLTANLVAICIVLTAVQASDKPALIASVMTGLMISIIGAVRYNPERARIIDWTNRRSIVQMLVLPILYATLFLIVVSSYSVGPIESIVYTTRVSPASSHTIVGTVINVDDTRLLILDRQSQELVSVMNSDLLARTPCRVPTSQAPILYQIFEPTVPEVPSNAGCDDRSSIF